MKNKLTSVFVLAFIGLAFGGTVAEAQLSNRTVITSHKLNYDYKRAIAVFEGSVVVADPQISIWSDKLTVIFDKQNNIKSVTAVGSVRLKQADKVATCQTAVYLVSSGEIVLMNNAKITKGIDSVAGDKITLFVADDKMIVEPAQLIIFPNRDKPAGTGVSSRIPVQKVVGQ